MKPHILALILAAAFTGCAPHRPPDGTVVVKFVVNEQGRVEDIQVVSSTNPQFTKSAVSSVSKWRFEPTAKDGKTVKTTVEKTLEFRLKDEGGVIPIQYPKNEEPCRTNRP